MSRTIWAAVVLISAASLPAGAIVYVSPNGDDTTGTTWATALFSVSDAVEAATAGEDIYVAAGTYIFGGSVSVPTGTEILGGFPATGSPGLFDRNPAQFETVLDGDGASGSIFVCSGATDVRIDGFTLRDCVGEDSGYAWGGAIRCLSGAEVEIRNCVFEDNVISGFGGGVNVFEATVEIRDCVFQNNTANEGGGVKVHQGTLEIDACTFDTNTASSTGGGLAAYDSDVDVSNSIFLNCSSPKGGGGECHEGTMAEFENCLFAGNSATQHGAAFNFEFQSGIQMNHCTFANNTSSGVAGGVFMHSSSGEIGNSIFYGNNAHAIYESDNSADPEVTNCLFHSNTTGVYFNEGAQTIVNASGVNSLNSILTEADGNLDGDPLFADEPNGDFHIRAGSPAIDAGAASNAVATDIDGSARPVDVEGTGQDETGNEYDIGFDEYDPSATLTVLDPNGGESIVRGDRHSITWEVGGYAGSEVAIELWRKGALVDTIKKRTPNDGSFKWKVSQDLPAKKGYKIKIVATGFPEFFDSSDGKFQITKD